MRQRAPLSLWKKESELPALVLLVDSPESEIWSDPTGGLVGEMEKRLPGVRVSIANAVATRGLDSALAAASFLGAKSAIVVRLSGRRSATRRESQIATNAHRMDVWYFDAQPHAESISSAYCTAALAQSLTVELAPCA